MNIAFFLTIKNEVSFLYEDFTLRQGLEKMKHHGYTAIPVLSRDGKYIGTLSEGDFLWYLFDEKSSQFNKDFKLIEKTSIKEIINTETYRAVSITASIDELVNLAMSQNFVPVVDDTNTFIGIVLRSAIIKHFSEK